jgi:hypothetical protein
MNATVRASLADPSAQACLVQDYVRVVQNHRFQTVIVSQPFMFSVGSDTFLSFNLDFCLLLDLLIWSIYTCKAQSRRYTGMRYVGSL